MDTVLEEAIQEHDSKKEELDRPKNGKTPSNEERSRVATMNKWVSKLDK